MTRAETSLPMEDSRMDPPAQPAAVEKPCPSDDIGWWNRFAFQGVRATLGGLTKLVGINGLYRCGKLFGTLEWLINYKRRRVFGQRLRRVFGDELTGAKRRKETLAHFQTTRCDKIFYLIFDLLPRDEVAKRFHQSALTRSVRKRGLEP